MQWSTRYDSVNVMLDYRAGEDRGGVYNTLLAYRMSTGGAGEKTF